MPQNPKFPHLCIFIGGVNPVGRKSRLYEGKNVSIQGWVVLHETINPQNTEKDEEVREMGQKPGGGPKVGNPVPKKNPPRGGGVYTPRWLWGFFRNDRNHHTYLFKDPHSLQHTFQAAKL